MTLSKIEHLSKEDIIKNGSIFTPSHIVEIAKEWLVDKISKEDTVIDFGVGYGAFISKFQELTNNLIATDIDANSISLVKSLFPNLNAILENSLINISRSKYGLTRTDKLFIIGNPPYNDMTSQYKKGQKGELEIDESIKSRDLGISFMKMYSILSPDYICILHPLSYLIKKTNFKSLTFFNDFYLLERGLVFSSNEFESIKKSNAEFPVVLALYKRNDYSKMTYSYIQHFHFEVLNSNITFCLNDYETIDGKISKYPSKELKNTSDLQFYTIRDINALKRNKSFLVGFSNNGIKVHLNDLYKYAWLDFFKNNFFSDKMFLYGNLSPLYSEQIEIQKVKKELISYILINNAVVNKYINDNNLIANIKEIYKIEEFIFDYPNLLKILNSFSK